MKRVTTVVLSFWLWVLGLISWLRWQGKNLLPSSKPRIRVYLPRGYSDELRVRTAVHEAGHAVLAWHARCIAHVSSAAIVADGDDESAGRVAFMIPLQLTQKDRWELVAVNLAGLAAEATVYDSIVCYGAEGDLQKARDLVEEIYQYERDKDGASTCPWGDADTSRVGSIASRVYEERQAPSRKEEIVDTCYRHALGKIREHRPRFDAIASELEKKDRLNVDELEAILGERRHGLF